MFRISHIPAQESSLQYFLFGQLLEVLKMKYALSFSYINLYSGNGLRGNLKNSILLNFGKFCA